MFRITLRGYAVDVPTLGDALEFLGAVGLVDGDAPAPEARRETTGGNLGPPQVSPAPRAELRSSELLSFAELAEREKRRQNGSFVPTSGAALLNTDGSPMATLPADERMVSYAAPVTVDEVSMVARLCAKCGRTIDAKVKALTVPADRLLEPCAKCGVFLTQDMPAEVREKHKALCPDRCPGHSDEELRA